MRSFTCGDLEVTEIPYNSDNLCYGISTRSGICFLVDTGVVSTSIDKYLAGKRCIFVLSTHKHSDHTAGNRYYASELNCPVYGSAEESFPGCTGKLKDKEQLEFVDGWIVTSFLCPGHTRSHMIYRVSTAKHRESVLFTGDLVFNCGMGRFFESSAAAMVRSVHRLVDMLLDIANDTYFLDGHNYTKRNVAFINYCGFTTSDTDFDRLSLSDEGWKEQNVSNAGTSLAHPWPTTFRYQLQNNLFIQAALGQLTLHSIPNFEKFEQEANGIIQMEPKDNKFAAIAALQTLRQAMNYFADKIYTG